MAKMQREHLGQPTQVNCYIAARVSRPAGRRESGPAFAWHFRCQRRRRLVRRFGRRSPAKRWRPDVVRLSSRNQRGRRRRELKRQSAGQAGGRHRTAQRVLCAAPLSKTPLHQGKNAKQFGMAPGFVLLLALCDGAGNAGAGQLNLVAGQRRLGEHPEIVRCAQQEAAGQDSVALLSKAPEKPLLVRVEEIRAEADKWIDSEAQKVKDLHPGLPFQTIRNLLTNRSGSCQCAAVRRISEQG